MNMLKKPRKIALSKKNQIVIEAIQKGEDVTERELRELLLNIGYLVEKVNSRIFERSDNAFRIWQNESLEYNMKMLKLYEDKYFSNLHRDRELYVDQ